MHLDLGTVRRRKKRMRLQEAQDPFKGRVDRRYLVFKHRVPISGFSMWRKRRMVAGHSGDDAAGKAARQLVLLRHLFSSLLQLVAYLNM